jgi:hypothetical protein
MAVQVMLLLYSLYNFHNLMYADGPWCTLHTSTFAPPAIKYLMENMPCALVGSCPNASSYSPYNYKELNFFLLVWCIR